MKRLIILYMLIFTGFTAANAQVETMTTQEFSNMIGNLRHSGIRMPQKATYIGSPYFTYWVKGYFILDNKKKTKILITRYNMTNNSVQFKGDKGILAVYGKKLNKYIIKASGKEGNIVFQNGFVSSKYGIKASALLRVIYNGNIKLLAQHTSKLLKNVSAYGVAGDVNEYRSNTHFYLVTTNGTFHEVDLNKEDILAALPGENKKLQAFVDKSNLDYSDEMQLDNILSYYNMLLKTKPNN